MDQAEEKVGNKQEKCIGKENKIVVEITNDDELESIIRHCMIQDKIEEFGKSYQ